MKNLVKISILAILVFFASCTRKAEKEQENLSVAINDAEIESPIAVEEIDSKENQRSVVFITGYDTGDKTFFSDARSYFKDQNTEVVETAFSLQEIILWLNVNKKSKPFSEVHIVANNKMNKNLLETTIKGAKVSANSIKEAVAAGQLPKLSNVLDKDAKVVLHSAGLGSQTALINEFKQVFTTDVKPSVIASENVSVFGGKFTEHYLAKPYYGFYPTANSPGRVDLAKEFIKKYPEIDIDWLSAMNNNSEKFQGDIYSYKFNIPVKWEIAYESDDEMPEFRTLEEMYAFMQDHDVISQDLNELNIPIEKFRWFQTVKEDKLIIKGMVTVVCVLEPVMSPAYPSEYMKPSIDNLRLYNRL